MIVFLCLNDEWNCSGYCDSDDYDAVSRARIQTARKYIDERIKDVEFHPVRGFHEWNGWTGSLPGRRTCGIIGWYADDVTRKIEDILVAADTAGRSAAQKAADAAFAAMEAAEL